MATSIKALKTIYPWITSPLIISAPMRIFSGPALATTVSLSGGIGFLGPGKNPSDLEPTLAATKKLFLQQLSSFPHAVPSNLTSHHLEETLPIGVGFQLFDGNLALAAAAVAKYRPRAAWLFVPGEKEGVEDLKSWSRALRNASPETQIWIQVGSVRDAIDAAELGDAPDVLVLQGNDAGGHGLAKGAGIVSLVPEVRDELEARGLNIPLMAAGGIADGRGVAAALALGASGAVMGTRFLASEEANIARGYREEIVRARDGGLSTVRTKVFDKVTGRLDWPRQYDGRSIINQSVEDDLAEVSVEDNRRKFEEALRMGDQGWGPNGRLTTYAGTAVGLISEVAPAEKIIKEGRATVLESLEKALLMV